MNKYVERIYNGLWKENPTIVLMLGMCPTLAVTTSAINGVGMGVSTLFVLVLSNLIISLCRKIIPDEVRLPAYIVIAASLVTVVDLIMQAYTPSLYDALGIYIPLIVVNCIILGRAEAFAGKNPVGRSALDGIGMGIGFTFALALMSILREFFGSGNLTLKVLGHGTTLVDIFHLGEGNVLSAIGADPIIIFILAPGGFFVYGLMIALANLLARKTNKDEADLNYCVVDALPEDAAPAVAETVVETEPQVKKVEGKGDAE